VLSFPDIPIYVISVRTFSDRHRHIKDLAESLDFNFEYIFEHDADELSEYDWSRVNRAMNPKSVSNTLKHLAAQERLIASGKTVGLVFEDDVIVFDGFVEHLNKTLELASRLDSGWLIFLGGADNKIDSRFSQSSDFSLIENPISTAEAYLVDIEGCLKRQTWLSSNIIDRQADHQLKLMDQWLGIAHFWTSKPLVTQGSITGDFKTALDQSRAKHGPLFLKWKYRWNCWRRQTLPRFLARVMRLLRG
jgi:glycosyl transferase, family 25